ncbi:Aspartate aminotransferase [Nymphon striatum]|nr:Aspartate aminotransferase [Nymphon striatum]
MISESSNTFLTVDRIRDKQGVSNLMLNDKIQELVHEGQDIFHFGFGQSPFSPMNEAIEELQKSCHHNEYLPVNGIKSLRVMISKFHKKYDNLNIDPDNIVVTPGSKESIFLLISSLLNGVKHPDSAFSVVDVTINNMARIYKSNSDINYIFIIEKRQDVILISPSWVSYGEQCSLLGKKTHILSTCFEDEWKITSKNLEKDFLRFLNKVCIKFVLDRENGLRTARVRTGQQIFLPLRISFKKQSLVCRTHNIIVISDEIYARLKFDTQHQSIAKFYPEGTVVTSGVSKWAALGGWRLGYSLFPPQLEELKKALCCLGSNSYSCVAAPIQFAVSKMLEKEDVCQEFIKSCTKILKLVGEYCYRELVSVGVKCLKPSGGLYLMPDFEIIREGLKKHGIETSEQLCDKLFKEKQVVVMSAHPSFMRPKHELTVRLCYVNFDGAKALETLNHFSGKITDDFIQSICPKTVEGINTTLIDQLRIARGKEDSEFRASEAYLAGILKLSNESGIFKSAFLISEDPSNLTRQFKKNYISVLEELIKKLVTHKVYILSTVTQQKIQVQLDIREDISV